MKKVIQKRLIILLIGCLGSLFSVHGAIKSPAELQKIREDMAVLVAGLKEEPKYKYVARGIMVFLDDSETRIDAISEGLVVTLAQKPSPIIVSAFLLKNVFFELYNNTSLDSKSSSELLASATKARSLADKATSVDIAAEKYAFAKACQFNPSEWVIKQVNQDLYLLLPQKYLHDNGVPLSQAEQFSGSGEFSPAEFTLGLKVNHMKTVGIDEVLSQPVSVKYNRADYFSKSMSDIFCTRSDYRGQLYGLPFWSFYMTGHGFMNQSIVGLNLSDFQKVLEFLEYKITTRLLFYQSCYAAGVNAEKLYKDAKSGIHKTYSFAIVTGVITDTPFTTKSPKLGLSPDKSSLTLSFEQDFVKFFQQSLGKDPIDYAAAVAAVDPLAPKKDNYSTIDLWGNVVQIKLPGIEWFSVAESKKDIVAIGSILAKTRAIGGSLDVSKYFKTEPRAILLYAQDMPFEIIIDDSDKIEAIISMVVGNAIHSIEKISTGADIKSILDWFMRVDMLDSEKIFFIKNINQTIKNAVVVCRKLSGGKMSDDIYVQKAFYSLGSDSYVYEKSQGKDIEKANLAQQKEYQGLIKKLQGEVQKIDALSLKKIGSKVSGLPISFDGLYHINTIVFTEGPTEQGHLGILFDEIKNKMSDGSIILVNQIHGGYASTDMDIDKFNSGDPITITNVVFDKDAGKILFTFNGLFYERKEKLMQDYLPEYQKKMTAGGGAASSGITREEIEKIKQILKVVGATTTPKNPYQDLFEKIQGDKKSNVNFEDLPNTIKGSYQIDLADVSTAPFNLLVGGLKNRLQDDSALLFKKLTVKYTDLTMNIPGFKYGDPITLTDVVLAKGVAGVFFTYGGKSYHEKEVVASITPVQTSPLQDKLQKLKSTIGALALNLKNLKQSLTSLKQKMVAISQPISPSTSAPTLPVAAKPTSILPVATKPPVTTPKPLPKALVKALKNSHTITTLDLNVGHLDELPDEIFQLKNLQELSLWGEDDENEKYVIKSEIKTISRDIVNLTKLKKLTIANCSLKSLPDEIGLLYNLQELDLHGNQIMILPDTIGTLQKLEILNLNYNKLEVLPDAICDLKNLKTFKLIFNNIKKFPKNIAQLTSLTTFSLAGNKLIEPGELVRVKGALPLVKHW